VRRGWVDRHPLMTSLLLVVAVAVPGFLRVEYAADKALEAAAAVKAETVRATAEACHSRRDTIIVLRGLVELTAETDSGGVRLTAIDGFDELPADMRFYLSNLEALLNASPPPDQGFVDRALERLPVPDC
jgi:hypothetical protein